MIKGNDNVFLRIIEISDVLIITPTIPHTLTKISTRHSKYIVLDLNLSYGLTIKEDCNVSILALSSTISSFFDPIKISKIVIKFI